jgi:host factor-I protein
MKEVCTMSEKPNSLQDTFLNACRKEKQQVTVYLNNGVKLQGIVSGFDNFSLILRRGAQTQLVYKHGIGTIVPMSPLALYGKEEKDDSDATDLPVITGEGSFQIA